MSLTTSNNSSLVLRQTLQCGDCTIGDNHAVHTEDSITLLQMENQTAVPGDGGRSPTEKYMRPKRELVKTDRVCPKCAATFGAVADNCKCPTCGHSFYASHVRSVQVTPTLPAEIVMRFVNAMTSGESEVAKIVQLSIEEPQAFYRKFGNRFEWETYFDVNPIEVAIAVLRDLNFVGTVDWRASPAEVSSEFKKVYAKKGFSNVAIYGLPLVHDIAASECLNNIALNVASQNLVMFQIAMPSDEFNFGIADISDFESISNIEMEDECRVF